MHVDAPRVLVWPNQDIFKHGILAGFPATFGTAENLSRLLMYCRGKGKNGWPNICYALWESYSHRHFALSPELAKLYFTNSRHVCMSLKETGLWECRFASCATDETRARMSDKMSVNALHLALYLYSQNVTLMQTQKFSLRSAEEYPTEKKGKKKSIDVRFIETFLSDIIKIVSDPESKGVPLDRQPLSESSVSALGCLFTVYTQHSIHGLTSVLQQQHHATTCGYSKLTKTFNALQVRSWLLDHMHANPFTSKRCLMHGRTVYQRPGRPRRSDTNNENGGTLTRCRVNVNDHEAPLDHRMLAMQYVSRQITALNTENLMNHRVHIAHCNDSSIYLLSSMRSVSVKQCSRTTLVTGPVAGTLYLTGCVGLRIISISRRVVLRNCHNCKLYLLTPTMPLLLAGCLDITLAPYNTFYPGLGGHLAHVHFNIDTNLWDKPASPMCIDGENSKGVWQLMAPDKFSLFAVPFNTEGTTTALVNKLPAEYAASVEKSKKGVQSWYEHVQQCDLTEAQTNQLASTIQGRFHDWLEANGHTKELENLIKMRDRS